MEDRRPGVTPRDLFAALPAVSAVTLGVLYGLGVFLSVSQLVGADVPVSETLPLIPLQDHLSKGLAAVFTSPGVFIGALGAFGAVLWGYAMSKSVERRRDSVSFSAGQVRALAAAVEAEHSSAGEQLRAEYAALKDEVAEAGRAGNPDDDARFAELAKRLADISARADAFMKRTDLIVEQAKQSGQAVNAEAASLQRTAERMDSFYRLAARSMPFAAGVLFVVAFFTPLDRILSPIVLGVLLLFAGRLIHYPVLLITLSLAAVLVPAAVTGYANPTPLPVATITTDAGTTGAVTTRGGLITSSGDRYVVTQRAGSYKAIPASEVKAVTVEKRDRERERSMFQLLL